MSLLNERQAESWLVTVLTRWARWLICTSTGCADMLWKFLPGIAVVRGYEAWRAGVRCEGGRDGECGSSILV